MTLEQLTKEVNIASEIAISLNDSFWSSVYLSFNPSIFLELLATEIITTPDRTITIPNT